MGGAVADVDTATGGPAHNLCKEGVLRCWRRRMLGGEFGVMFAGGPCATFSPLHDPQLRSIREPDGMATAPAEWRAHILSANTLWDATALLARDIFGAGGEFAIEYPQRRYIPGRRAFWREMADRGVCSPGDLQSLLDLERDTGAQRIDIAQCAFASPFQKFTTFLCSPRLAARLRHLQGRRCARCDRYQAHEERAAGVFADGDSRSAAAARYPSRLCFELALAAADCPILQRRSPLSSDLLDRLGPDGPMPGPGVGDLPPLADDASDGLSDCMSEASTQLGGIPPLARREGLSADAGCPDAARNEMLLSGVSSPEDDHLDGIAAGPALPAAVRARIQEARLAPPKFASIRNLADATAEELRRAHMPHLPAVTSDPQPAPTAAAWGADHVGPQHARPSSPIRIDMLFLPGVFRRIEEWRASAELAIQSIAAGRPARPPATLIIPQSELQPWARGLIWDTRNSADCTWVEPSTADTPPTCPRAIRRARLHEAAERLDWPDLDLRGQVTGGGIESRSACSGDTVLAFHHAGIADYFKEADAAIRSDVAAGSVLTGFTTLPFVPCRSLPRNVILQQRSRVLPNGEVEDYDKPRVTTNLSCGEGELGDGGSAPLSVNDGVPQDERYVRLPTVRELGRGSAIVGEAGKADGLHAELYCFDLSAAFRYAPIQRRDWWQHVFLWLTPEGRAEWMIDPSGAFGGAYMPQRFERLTNLGVALARADQDAFDAAHPYPPGVRAWVRERTAMQEAGNLPAGPEQLRPAHIHVYLDDSAGSALNDTVPVPTALRDISLGALATRTLGGTPSLFDSRAAVHLRIAIASFERLGFLVEASKTECGTSIVNLGFRIRADARRIDCPLPKRRILLRDVRRLRDEVDTGQPLDQRGVERLTGRLANMSHVMPELAMCLAGGYAVASARQSRRASDTLRRGRRRRVDLVRLRRGGKCESSLRAMCDVAEHLLDSNEGIALAAAEHFREVGSAGTLTTVSDASGEDGIGGYAFHPGAPGVVWVLADAWPPDVLAALSHAASVRKDRAAATARSPACSMPLAELFGPWVVAAAVGEHIEIEAVISVVDCAPAAAVLSAATSSGAQLRHLVGAARRDVRQWLAAAVPRELNSDADILSHPARWEEVARSASSVGLAVRRVHVPPRCWDVLRTAMALPMGREAAAWRESGEVLSVGPYTATGRHTHGSKTQFVLPPGLPGDWCPGGTPRSPPSSMWPTSTVHIPLHTQADARRRRLLRRAPTLVGLTASRAAGVCASAAVGTRAPVSVHCWTAIHRGAPTGNPPRRMWMWRLPRPHSARPSLPTWRRRRRPLPLPRRHTCGAPRTLATLPPPFGLRRPMSAWKPVDPW